MIVLFFNWIYWRKNIMKIIKSILTKNPCYTAGRKITVKGLMLHSVGCSQPSARVFVQMWNSPSYGAACVHGFIDGNSGNIYQTLPWNHRGWHCGSGRNGSGNNTHIGVSLQRFGIQVAVRLHAPIWQMQEPVQDVHTMLLWSCSPTCAKSMALTQ